MGAKTLAVAVYVYNFHRRVEMGAGLAIGAGAIGTDARFHRGDFAGKPPNCVKSLGQKIGLTGIGGIAVLRQRVSFGFVLLPGLAPDRNPMLFGRGSES